MANSVDGLLSGGNGTLVGATRRVQLDRVARLVAEQARTAGDMLTTPEAIQAEIEDDATRIIPRLAQVFGSFLPSRVPPVGGVDADDYDYIVTRAIAIYGGAR